MDQIPHVTDLEGAEQLSAMKKELSELKELLKSKQSPSDSWDANSGSNNNKVHGTPTNLLLSQMFQKLFHYYILGRGHLSLLLQNVVVRIIFVLAIVVLFINAMEYFDKDSKGGLRPSSSREAFNDPYTVYYKGYYYRTLRPNVAIDSFTNKYLENERQILLCPVKFPMPEGYELVPEIDRVDIVKNVVSKHYWSSSALIVSEFAAYPTLTLISQIKRPYPVVTTSAQELQLLTSQKDPFKNMGAWFTESGGSEKGEQVWLQQNLLSVNTRECLMIVYSFAARGFRDDNVEDIIPACELCSANILIRSKTAF